MKRILVLGSLLMIAAPGCGIRGAPHPPAEPQPPPELHPSGTGGPADGTTQRGPFAPSTPPPDAGTSAPADAGTADAGGSGQP